MLTFNWFYFLFFKRKPQNRGAQYEVKWFFFCWQLQTRYHIFGLCQSGGRSWLEEEERTEAALVFLSARHLRRNSVTHLKPSK